MKCKDPRKENLNKEFKEIKNEITIHSFFFNKKLVYKKQGLKDQKN